MTEAMQNSSHDNTDIDMHQKMIGLLLLRFMLNLNLATHMHPQGFQKGFPFRLMVTVDTSSNCCPGSQDMHGGHINIIHFTIFVDL